MRLLPYLRLKQSKIRLRFDFWFKRRISQVPNLMHELQKIIMIHLLPTIRPNFRECHARKSQNNNNNKKKKWRETKGFVVLALQRQNILVWRAVISLICMRCSVFEKDEDTPGWKEAKSVAYCESCFNEMMERESSQSIMTKSQDDEAFSEDEKVPFVDW